MSHDERKPPIPLAAVGAAGGLGVSMAHRNPSMYGGDVLLAVICGASAGAIIEWATPRIDAATVAVMALTSVAAYALSSVSKST